LPPRRWGQSFLKRDPLRFSRDEISGIRVPHRTKIIGSRIGPGANQKLGGRLLRKSGREISGKVENLNAERSLRERNLPEHLGFELPLGI
jgi:hypothetical protein